MKPTRRHASVILLAAVCVALLAPSGIASAASSTFLSPGTGVELVFSGDTARSLAGEVAVPVDCLGESRGFCSGTVTLSRAGRHRTVPFSIRAGGHESLLVPFPDADLGEALKLRGTATTSQPLGSPTSREAYLYAH
jgi:hypothetical protein